MEHEFVSRDQRLFVHIESSLDSLFFTDLAVERMSQAIGPVLFAAVDTVIHLYGRYEGGVTSFHKLAVDITGEDRRDESFEVAADERYTMTRTVSVVTVLSAINMIWAAVNSLEQIDDHQVVAALWLAVMSLETGVQAFKWYKEGELQTTDGLSRKVYVFEFGNSTKGEIGAVFRIISTSLREAHAKVMKMADQDRNIRIVGSQSGLDLGIIRDVYVNLSHFSPYNLTEVQEASS